MSTAKLRAGQVVRVRINPKDCLSTLDLLDTLHIPRAGMSFAQCVSLAFSSLMETARLQGLLPEPDTFQFLNRMGPFAGHQQHQRKTTISKEIGGLGEKFLAPALSQERAMLSEAFVQPRHEAAGSIPHQPIQPEKEPSEFELAQRQRLTELLKLKDMRELTGAETVEYKELYSIVYPHG